MLQCCSYALYLFILQKILPDYIVMEIRRLQEQEISMAQEILPGSWGSDLSSLFVKNMNNKSFQPLAAFKKGEIAAFGQAFIFDKTAWLGNISVKSGFRNQGIGSLLTGELIDFCWSRGVKSINLIATEMGERLYRKLGFTDDTVYLFYQGVCYEDISSSIKKIEPDDQCSILDINYMVTGEIRDSLLNEYLPGGYKYISDDNEITGFFLPDFGNGLILAMNNEAGNELLKFKHQNKTGITVLSEENENGVNFLQDMNFTKINRSKRMYLGEYTRWYPENTFCRGTTYTG